MVVALGLLLRRLLGGGVARVGHIGIVVDLVDAAADDVAVHLGRNAAPAVHDEGNVRLLLHRVDDVEVENGRRLIDAVRRSEGDGERIDARPFQKVRHEFGLGVERGGVCSRLPRAVLAGGERAQLRLHFHAARMGVFGHFRRALHVLFIGKRRVVDHHGRKPVRDGALAVVEVLAVVEMHAHGHLGVLCRRHHEGRDLVERGGVVVALCVRDDDGHIQLFRRIDDRPQTLRVWGVEAAHGSPLALCELTNFL